MSLLPKTHVEVPVLTLKMKSTRMVGKLTVKKKRQSTAALLTTKLRWVAMKNRTIIHWFLSSGASNIKSTVSSFFSTMKAQKVVTTSVGSV